VCRSQYRKRIMHVPQKENANGDRGRLIRFEKRSAL
jgi:hypothetical protein